MTFVQRLLKWLMPAIAMVVFVAAIYFITRFLHQYSPEVLARSLESIAPVKLLGALALTIVAYLVLGCYDLMALHFVGEQIKYRRTLFTSFVAFAFSNSIGLANLAGGSIRMRLYKAFGIPTGSVIKMIAFVSSTFWLGFFALAGLSFTLFGIQIPESLGIPEVLTRWLGIGLLSLVSAYLIYTGTAKRGLRFRGLSVELPGLRLAMGQVFIAVCDWLLASSILFVLLPDSSVGFPVFLSIYLSAQFIALVAHVPGGIGVLEAIVIHFITPDHHSTPELIASLLAFRAIYYFLPLVSAGLSLIGYEIYLRRTQAYAVSRRALALVGPLAPTVSGALSLVAGAILIFSGALPAVDARSALLAGLVPLSAIEISHFIGSCLGVVLLAVSLGLVAKSRSAWSVAIVSSSLGAVVSIIKGLDYEEATALVFFALYLYAAREEFYRPSRLLSEKFSPSWIVTIFVIVGTSVWIGFFSYRNVEYSHDLWWQFSFEGDAPRFLRALVGIAVTGLTICVHRLLRPPAAVLPQFEFKEAEVLPTIRSASDTMANLALLGDKRLFFNDERTAFLMYAVRGHTWVVLGDPVGEIKHIDDLLSDFRSLADRYDGQVVFYEVRAEHLPSYIDLGMMFIKLGEEARVKLADFSLEGGARKSMRQNYNRLTHGGVLFHIYPPEKWPTISDQIKKVSDSWLRQKRTAEKGFSLGYFDEHYLSHFPIAVLEQEGRILAFANLWEGARLEELSIDLMRYDPAGPHGLMEQLTVEIMFWGKAQGYRYFNLGMAPLSGLDKAKFGSRWNRVGRLLYEHADRFYNFQGLRRYKEKFHPEWQPRYLAYPSKVVLPLVLKDLAILISGGVKGAVAR